MICLLGIKDGANCMSVGKKKYSKKQMNLNPNNKHKQI